MNDRLEIVYMNIYEYTNIFLKNTLKKLAVMDATMNRLKQECKVERHNLIMRSHPFQKNRFPFSIKNDYYSIKLVVFLITNRCSYKYSTIHI